MIYTSKQNIEYTNSSGRINRVNLLYQTQAYDLYIFLRLFDFNLVNLLIYKIKNRLLNLLSIKAIIKRTFC